MLLQILKVQQVITLSRWALRSTEDGERNIPEDLQEKISENKSETLEINGEKKGLKNNFDLKLGEGIHLLPLFTVTFIETLGFTIVFPFLVFLVNRMGGNAFIYGLATSMYSGFRFIGAPILGRWSDIYGRKKILLLCEFGTLISWIIFLGALYLPLITLFKVDSRLLGTFTFTLPLAILFFARAFDGVTGGDTSVAYAYLTDITEEKDRIRNFGRLYIASNLGFIIGPALAGILSVTDYGYTIPVAGAIIISLIGVLLVIFYIPEDKECSLDKPEVTWNIRKIYGHSIKECKNTRNVRKLSFKEVFKLPNIPYMLCLYFLLFLGSGIFYTAFSLQAIAVLYWDVPQIGIYFTVLSALLIIVQGTILQRALKIYSDSTLVIFGSLMFGTNFMFLIPGNLFLTYLAMGFYALGNGFLWPSFTSLLSKITGGEYQGTIQGCASSLGSLASITGLILGGLLYESLAGKTFLVAGVIIYTTFLLNIRLRHFEKELK